MEQEHISQFEEFEPLPFFRRSLLPLWMKIFCWLFMVMGALGALNPFTGLLGYSFEVSIFGMESESAFSLMGILATIVFLFKGYTAYSLWFEKDNAIMLGKIDAVAGIIICIIMMAVSPMLTEGTFSFRFELIFLIPYYQKLSKIEYSWHNRQYN
jgi:hypothetical protein